jgi:hypothetical protein
MNVAIKAREHHAEPELGFISQVYLFDRSQSIAKQYMALSAVMTMIGGFSAYPHPMAARVAGNLDPRMGSDRS